MMQPHQNLYTYSEIQTYSDHIVSSLHQLQTSYSEIHTKSQLFGFLPFASQFTSMPTTAYTLQYPIQSKKSHLVKKIEKPLFLFLNFRLE